MTIDFEQAFLNWLDDGLAQPKPDSVRAFSFNLYQPAFEPGVKFGIELIGAAKFEQDDSDWACYEVWEPKPRGISIPVEYSGGD